MIRDDDVKDRMQFSQTPVWRREDFQRDLINDMMLAVLGTWDISTAIMRKVMALGGE